MGEVYPRFAAGLRRLSPQQVNAAAAAAHFEGLPASVSRGQVLAAFKRAAPYLHIAPRLRDAVDVLMAYSQPQDWAADSRPIVWPSNAVLQEQLGLARRQVQYLIRALIDHALVVAVDSPTGRRWGRRHPATGKIVEAYGFDLSPLAQRYAAFVAAAERGRKDRAARAALRRRLTIARKAIRQIAEAALEAASDDRDWAAWAEDGLQLPGGIGDMRNPGTLEAAVVALEEHRREGEKALETMFCSNDAAPADAVHCAAITTTNQPQADQSATSNLCPETGRSPTGEAFPANDGAQSENGATTLDEHKVTPRFVLRISPALRPYVVSRSPTWAQIVDAADWVRADLGIGRHAWTEACDAMGRYAAACAVAVIAAKASEIRSAGGYLRAMTERARQGELHLGKSLYGLAERRRKALI